MKCFQVRETYFASTSYHRDSQCIFFTFFIHIGKMFKIQNCSIFQFIIYDNIRFNHTWPNIIHVPYKYAIFKKDFKTKNRKKRKLVPVH